MEIGRSTKRAILGGALSLLVILTGTFLLGRLSGYEAKVLIKNSLDGLNTLCNTIALASATILALLLTLLSLSIRSDSQFKKGFYQQVLQIAKLDTAVFIAAVISFLLLNLPITESKSVPPNWFNSIYYISLALSSVLSASLIVVVLMLYNMVVNIIRIVGFREKDHPMAFPADTERIMEKNKDD